MSKLPENVKDILHSETFKRYLRARNMQSLYEFISYNIDYDTWISVITDILYRSGINPLMNQEAIPRKFFIYSKQDYIKNFIIPNGIKAIGYKAFAFSCIEKVKFPNSLERIKAGAFEGCFALSTIEFPKSLKSIGENAFKDCNKLEKIIIPENVTGIHPRSFPRKVIKFEGTTEKFERVCNISLINDIESTFIRVECKDGILIPIQGKHFVRFERK